MGKTLIGHKQWVTALSWKPLHLYVKCKDTHFCLHVTNQSCLQFLPLQAWVCSLCSQDRSQTRFNLFLNLQAGVNTSFAFHLSFYIHCTCSVHITCSTTLLFCFMVYFAGTGNVDCLPVPPR